MWRKIATGAAIGALCFAAGYRAGSRSIVHIRWQGSLDQPDGWNDVVGQW